MNKKYFIIFTLIILGIMPLTPVFAYVYNGYKWSNNSVTYYVNETWANWHGVTATTLAAQAWNQAGGAFTFVYGGTTLRNPNTFDDINYTNDNFNDIGFYPAGNNGVIARVAELRWPSSPTVIFEADLTFNTHYPFSNNGEPDFYDVRNITTHELGHWLSLGHTQWYNCWPFTLNSATMCDFALTGDVSYQTLEQDDIDGAKSIYPYHTVSGIISQNTTWYQNRTYVVQGAVTVNAGVMLTIQPGVVIKFQDTSSALVINGTLNVIGASLSKVYFTSLKDDTVGGDTNGDGSASSPGAGDWQTLQFNSGSTGDISNAVIRYAGNYYGSAVYNDGGTLTITGLTFDNNNGIAIIHSSGTLTVTSSEISNGDYGVYAYGSGNLTLNNNTFSNLWLGVGYIDASINFSHSGNNASNMTGKKGFIMAGNITADRTWTADNLPYIISSSPLSINATKTLTLEPGAIIKFQDNWSSLEVNGTLSAQGTSQNKIYFTSFYDDSVGGDTDGDPWRSPQAGDWQYIQFNPGSVGNLSNAIIRYAGSYYGYGIYNNGGAINISESEIAYNQSRGLYIDSGSATVTGTNFHDNSDRGISAYAWSGMTTLTLNNNTFATTDNSMAAEIDASVDFNHSGNTSSGTGWNGFTMFGFMSANRVWTTDNMPYIANGVSIPEFTTLTIDPGAIVKMGGFDVQGTLQANGTSQNKIYFTSICDDEIGGDTNGRSCSEWEYSWGPLWLSYSSAANFSNAVFRYGGGGWDESPVIIADTADLTVTDSVFNYNGGPAARVNSSSNFTHSGNTASDNVKNGFEIYGAVDNNQTWNADLTYIIKDIDVWGNLTLNHGVIMKFNHTEDDWSSNGLTVNGTLNVTGTATSTIFFTSIKDDEPGGDTNGDGSATTPSPGDWRPIKFIHGSQGTFSHSKVRYGGMYDWYYGWVGSYPAVYNNGGTLNISNSQIEKTAQWIGTGIVQTGGSLSVNSSEFNNQYIGVSVQGGSASILQNNFHDNSYGFGAGNENVSALTLNSNTFTNNSLAAVFIDASINFTHSGNIATGSGKRGFMIGGWITQDRTWTSGDLPYIISGGATIDSGATLTIQPGAIVKLCTSDCLPWTYSPASISVLGVLQANGLPDNKISFTSIKDDDIGGDTNGDGPSSGAPRDWDSVSFWPGSQGNFSNVIIRYGGGGYNDDGAISTSHGGGGTINISNSQINHNGTYGIYHENGSLSITGTDIHDHSYGIYNYGNLSVSNSKIFNNTSYGIYQEAGTLTITNSELFNQEYGLYIDNGEASASQNNFHDNSTYGLYNNVALLPGVNAENNYWGSPSGPYHPYWNPNGTGNPVSDYVDFDPWLTQWP